MIKMPLAAKILDGVLFFVFGMPKYGSPLGQTDPVEKSSAEPREAYKRTLSGETAIENENPIKMEENRRFSTLISSQIRKKQRMRDRS